MSLRTIIKNLCCSHHNSEALHESLPPPNVVRQPLVQQKVALNNPNEAPPSISFPKKVETPVTTTSPKAGPQHKSNAVTPTTPKTITKPTATPEKPIMMQRLQNMTASTTIKGSQANGTNGMNGHFSPPESPSAKFGGSAHGSARGSRRMTSSFSMTRGGQTQSSVVRDTAMALKRKSASELDAGISDTADSVGFIDLVEWIRSERLQTLPHKGSRWDTVLIRALYFAERLQGFESALKGHALDSEHAAQLGYGHIRLLLELGHENGEALDKAFGFMYRCSSAVSSLLARSEVLSLSSNVYGQLCMMYSDLLTLVVDVAVRFYKIVHGSTGHQSSLDMFEIFGNTITTFRERRETVTKAIWKDQIDTEDPSHDVDIKSLERWLAPQDSVLETLTLDHTLIADEQAEFTCVWFLDDLTKFVKSDDHSLLINGQSGSGKTSLAASLAERLQRPVARKNYAPVFCSVGAVPSQATSPHVVKSLLHQLLSLRVGNLHLYHAVAHAYEKARYTADPDKYEDLLWHAFEDALRHPIEQGRDTVLIVEGLDEVLGGQSAGQGLLQRLVHAIDQGKCVKLIGLAEKLTLPTGAHGSQRMISSDDTRDDVHSVAIKILARSQHFRSRTGRDQETIIGHIINTAQGSFLWATLTCEVLRLEKSADDFNKAISNLSNPRLSIDDLVQILLSRLQLTDDAKLVLAWVVYGARPLTYREIESLFTVNVQTGSKADRRVDIHLTVQSLGPLVTVQEDIIRPKHTLVQNAARNLLKSGKVTLSVKDQPYDLLLRILAYAKVALSEKGEPTLDDSDRSLVDISFNRHPLLEYVVRYWTWHLQQTSVIVPGKPNELKVLPEIQKVFPDSVQMPILEWLCWDDQFPGAQEVEFHDIVGRLRSKVLTEQHPAVLQSYINTACYYEMMEDTTKASTLYYLITTIGRTVLSVSHPIVVECGTRFLHMSETHIRTTRTEIMTHREQILILLISAYERQFGQSSEIVIRTREQLAELYISIKEEEKATEILRVIHGHSVDTYGHGSEQTRAVDNHLRVTLGKSKDATALESYEGAIFIDEEEDEERKAIVSLEQVDALLKQIESYKSKQDFVSAEQTYIELWQSLSQTCRTTMAAEWHEKKIAVVQSYANYLETHKRRTEAISLLTSVWREYEHHELSYSDRIVSRLTESARFLKSVGEYSASLSIFRHASSYYRSVRKDESRSFTEIEEELTTLSTQALTQTTKDEKHSSSSSEKTNYEMFQMLISNKSKSIESSTLTLSKSLTSKYIEQRQWSQAVSVIQSTLERTWTSFLARSVHEVTMTTTYQKESIELVEQLAEVYTQQRLFEKAEDIYVRLFRAALTTPKDQTLLEKAKTLLLGFYTKRGHPGKAIGVYQELLAVYRRTLGPSHDTTIAVLYELATRCRHNARSHPYWIEYYQQIVTALNKDSTRCHARALEAAIIVAESYWEEHRYSDAVSAYSIIWSTFVHNHKEYKAFSEVSFVRCLYERYYQSLEETKADFEVLRTLTSQYQATTKVAFGASSTLFIESTLALARVNQQSEAHLEESLRLYEEAQSQISKSSSKEVSSHFQHTELSQTMTQLYRKRIFHSSSSSASSETVAKATSMYQSQLSEHKSRYSYAHEETLSSLRELSMLYVRQQKTELAVKELDFAAIDICQHETSAEKVYSSAVSLVQSYQAASLMQQCTQLVEEMHYQLITREKRSSSSFSVVEATSASLFFLAVLEYNIRKDTSLTLSEIMACLTAESVMYRNFKQLHQSKASLDKLLIAAAPLRHLLKYWNRTGIVSSVDHECVQIFVQREASSVQLLSKESPRYFIIGILDHLGNRKCVDFVRTVVLASNKTLKTLIDNNQFADAHDVAKMGFMYAQHRKGYLGPKGISRGFELASYLDGRGENRCPDPELRKKLLNLSSQIIKDVLKICREQKINFAQVSLKELNELIALLGEQQDYETLEELLNTLWTTREAQKSWPPHVLLNLGRLLICSRYLSGHQIKALRLCEDIAYNLRRVNGIKHPATLETYRLLAELYTTTAQHYQKEASQDKSAAVLATEHFKKAVLIHEDVLRWVISDAGAVGAGDDDDDDTAASILAGHGIFHSGHGGEDHEGNNGGLTPAKRAELVKYHLRMLKLSYQRLGHWPKDFGSYEKLNAELFRVFGEQLKGAEGVEKWTVKGFGGGKAESQEGVFAGAKSWELLEV